MISPQELIEKIVSAADYEDCVVIVESKTQANLRWANSTLTTNGVIANQKVHGDRICSYGWWYCCGINHSSQR
jgi:hypothetical protein